MKPDLGKLKFDAEGLIPAIVQEASSGQVLMLAYMNEEALKRTLDTGRTWFWSRSRQQLWPKGETSGNIQRVRSLHCDCDADALLVRVEQQGVACHEGYPSCFHHVVYEDPGSRGSTSHLGIFEELTHVIADRKRNPREGSYTSLLFSRGRDAILKKIGEEAAEVIIASKNGDAGELRYEAADLLFHLMVLLEDHGLSLQDVAAELRSRR